MLLSKPKKLKESKANTTNLLIYPPNPGTFPKQVGPVCYYYSLIRMMEFQSNSYSSQIPPYCEHIIREIIIVSSNTTSDDTNFISRIDGIFRNNLNENILKTLNLPKDDEEEEEEENNSVSVDDFMDEYPHSYAMALLLKMRLIPFDFTDITIRTLYNHLQQLGPMVFDGQFALSSATLKLLQRKRITSHISFLQVNDEQLRNEQHSILVIGCQQKPKKAVFYIDPNYPDNILSMSFAAFKNRVLDTGNGLMCHPRNQISPTKLNEAVALPSPSPLFSLFVPTITFNKRSEFSYLSSINLDSRKRKFTPKIAPIDPTAPTFPGEKGNSKFI